MISRFLSNVRDFSPLLLAVMAVCNLVMAFNVRSTVRKSSSVVVTNYVDLVNFPSPVSVGTSSNTVSSLFGSLGSLVPSSSPDLPSVSSSEKEERKVFCNLPYQYFVANRRIGAQICGRYFYEGSLCSGGYISKIFPDRILLEDGSFIVNSNLEGGRVR